MIQIVYHFILYSVAKPNEFNQSRNSILKFVRNKLCQNIPDPSHFGKSSLVILVEINLYFLIKTAINDTIIFFANPIPGQSLHGAITNKSNVSHIKYTYITKYTLPQTKKQTNSYKYTYNCLQPHMKQSI